MDNQENDSTDERTPSTEPGFCQKNPPSRFHCSPEFHFAQNSLAGLLYSWARRLSKSSGRFHASQESIAVYLAVSRWTIARAINYLVKLGFFEPINEERFHPAVYRVLEHTEWVKKHPGQCAVKETFPWSGEDSDRLGRDLWNASGGKVKYQPFQLSALRKTGLSDDEIVHAFRHLIDKENRRRQDGGWRGRWGRIPFRFLSWINGSMGQGELERLGLAPFGDFRNSQ